MDHRNSAADPSSQGAWFMAWVVCFIDGLSDIDRKRAIIAVVVAVEDNNGNVDKVRMPYVPGSPKYVPVEELAKRLSTSADRILV